MGRSLRSWAARSNFSVFVSSAFQLCVRVSKLSGFPLNEPKGVSVSQPTRWVYFPVVTKMTSVLCCQMTGSNEFKLNQTPDDGISSVKFSPNTSQFLLVSSWDTTVRLYDVPANSMRLKYQHSGAVLDCAFYVSVCEVCFSIVFHGLTVHKVREKLKLKG